MDNGWRNALLGLWIILAVAAVSFGTAAAVIVSRAGSEMSADAALRSGILLYTSIGCLTGFVLFLSLWIVVSAVVREHEKDRIEIRKLRA